MEHDNRLETPGAPPDRPVQKSYVTLSQNFYFKFLFLNFLFSEGRT